MTVLLRGEVYAHVARSLSFDGRSLTLVDLAPSTFWMSPEPDSALGYLPTGAFLDLWAETAPGQGAARCVGGVLSLLDPDAQLAGQAILTVHNPRMTVSGLTYDAEVVEGLVPTRSGACVLFLQWDTATLGGGPAPALPPRSRESGRAS